MLILSPGQNTFTDSAQSLKPVKVVTGIDLPLHFLCCGVHLFVGFFVCVWVVCLVLFLIFCHWIARESQLLPDGGVNSNFRGIFFY